MQLRKSRTRVSVSRQERVSYEDRLLRKIREARRKRNAEAVVYYQGVLKMGVACVPYDQFQLTPEWYSWINLPAVESAIQQEQQTQGLRRETL